MEAFYQQYVSLDDKGRLTTSGCGCCCDRVTTTPEVLRQAIEEAEAWLEALKTAWKEVIKNDYSI